MRDALRDCSVRGAPRTSLATCFLLLHCQSLASPRMGRWLARLIFCVTALGLTCSCC